MTNEPDMGDWTYLNGQPVTYLGTDDDGYVLYTESHIEIFSTKPSMFRLVKDPS